MKKIVTMWHEVATEGLPDASGAYLVLTRNGSPDCLPYSHRYRVFNAHDFGTPDEAYATAIECSWWAEIPDELKAISADACRAWLEREDRA